MTVQITIVGLGQIGASVGLALEKQHDYMHRVGHDKSFTLAKKAQKNGAVDEVKFNLPASVRKANIVLLSLPMNEIRSTLELIAPDLPKGAVVLATAPLQSPVAAWAQELLPDGRYYIGFVPAINPEYLYSVELGLEAAKADLFNGSVIIPVHLRGTPEEAIKLATDLIAMLDATPLFADMAESDGLMTSIHTVPQLLAVAMLNTVVDQPGWKEARQLAGRPFASLTSALAYQDEYKALGEAALLNKENTTRVLDGIIASLQGLRDDIAADKRDEVFDRIKTAADGHDHWIAERLRRKNSLGNKGMQDLSNKKPSFMEQLFGYRKRTIRRD